MKSKDLSKRDLEQLKELLDKVTEAKVIDVKSHVVKQIYTLHNKFFNRRDMVTGCSKAAVSRLLDLRNLYNEYQEDIEPVEEEEESDFSELSPEKRPMAEDNLSGMTLKEVSAKYGVREGSLRNYFSRKGIRKK